MYADLKITYDFLNRFLLLNICRKHIEKYKYSVLIIIEPLFYKQYTKLF